MSTHNGARIHPGLPRTSVLATFPDGRIFEAPIGTLVGDIVRTQSELAPSALPVQGTPSPTDGAPVVAVMLNGRLRELTTALTEDAEIAPVTTADGDGVRIYRRSLSFLLVAAAGEIFPGVQVSIEHSASTVGGYFCEVQGREPFTQTDLARIEARMRDIVAADAPIAKTPISVVEAMALFRQRGELERERLMAHREKETVALHTLRGRQEYFQGYMVPSTGCLKHFALHAFPPGFLLQFPHQSRPTEIAPVVPYPKLFAVFEEAGHLLDRLGVRSAGALNDAIASGRLAEVSLVGEAIHESRIAQHRVRHCGAGRPGQAGAHCRAVVIGEDHVLEAACRCSCWRTGAGRSRSRSTTISWIARRRRGMPPGSSTTSASRRWTWRCSTRTC